MENIITKEGYSYSFNTNACLTCKGNCCIGKSGYIWIDQNEIQKVANFLNLDILDFIDNYLIKVKYKFSIKEKPFNDGFACWFFDEEKLQCRIYEARPKQCKTFPFWDYFKTHINEVEQECPGILV